MRKTTKIWLIYEERMPMDRMIEVWSTEEAAEARAKQLLIDRPSADGFYVEVSELHG